MNEEIRTFLDDTNIYTLLDALAVPAMENLEGSALSRVFGSRAGQDADIPRDEAALVPLAGEELKLTLGITAEPIVARVFIWEYAMPQYNLGHPDLLKRIDAALEQHSGLALAGNGYRGIGIPDCIHSGELALEKVTRDLVSSQ